MVVRQPTWDKYEAVLLLDGLLEIVQGDAVRREIIKRVSTDLRKLALNRGVAIDELYRNENGISFQMQSMESAFFGHTIFKPATKLFVEVADLYKNHFDDYERLVKEANAMIAGNTSVESSFMQYLSAKVSPAQLSELYWCYSEIESFCLKVKVLHKPLFQTTDFDIIKKAQRTIEQNKIFRITHKKQFNKIIAAGRHYYNYVKEGRFPQSKDEVTVTVHPSDEAPVVVEATPEHTIAAKPTDLPMVRTEQDNRLLQKYPIIYKRAFFALRESSENCTVGVSVEELNARINRIVRPAILEELLDNVSWASTSGVNYLFSSDIVDHTVLVDETTPEVQKPESGLKAEAVYTVDFTKPFDLAFTKPESFSYFEEKRPCGASWTELYVSFLATVLEDYAHLFAAGMSFSKGQGRIELADKSDCDFMISPKPIFGTDYMLETNVSASNIVSKIKYILEMCNVDYENIVIRFRHKADTSTEESNDQSDIAPSVNSRVNSVSFSQYLADIQKMADASCRGYASSIRTCESYAKEHGFSSWQLYTDDRETAVKTVGLLRSNADFLEYNSQQHNRFSAALSKFLLFIGTDVSCVVSSDSPAEEKTYCTDEYEAVLRQYFSKGYRMESALEVRKFRKYYAALHVAELADSDDEVSSNIKRLCILHEGKAFLPSGMLSEELKERVFAYINESFADGKTAVYYQAIFAEFSEAFLDYHIHDADMLKAYLTHMNNGTFFINRSFVSQTPNVSLDALSEIRICLQGCARPVEYDELFASLPHLPQSKVKFILASNGEFINNGRGAYFHESAVVLSDEELEAIASIIEDTIIEKDFIGGNELYEAIKSKYPYIIEGNHQYSVYGFRDALKYKLGDRFSFKGNVISRAGQVLSMADVFANYAKHRDSFTLSELQALSSDLATSIYFDSVYENSLRISKDKFVSKSRAQFSVPETDAAIDRFCTGDYIPIQEVTNFGIFPYAGFPWNCYLLEHFVADYSQKYRLLHSSYNGTEFAGVIVKRSIGIDDFDELLTVVLAESGIELNKATALQYLADRGYLARRRYSNIESLIIKASARRNRKDTD